MDFKLTRYTSELTHSQNLSKNVIALLSILSLVQMANNFHKGDKFKAQNMETESPTVWK